MTAYFNPGRDRRRLRNFRLFRARLDVPLVAVELVHSERAELGAGDAEILVQLAGTDVLWQREQLLNLGLARVPPAVRAVAWLDADVVFERVDWPRLACALLADAPAVQLYEELVESRPALAGQPASCRLEPTADVPSRSVASRIGEGADDDLLLNAFARGERSAPRSRAGSGIGWAYRRDVLEDLGLYNGSVVGGNDRAMVCAMLGRFDIAARNWGMNDGRRKHFAAWAEPFHERIRGRVGFLTQRAFHLWHGEIAARGYGLRHGILQRLDFDPYVDVAVDDRGLLRWNSVKPELHAFVRDWLVARPLED